MKKHKKRFYIYGYFGISVHSRQTRLTETRTSFFTISAPFCRTVAYQHDFFIVMLLVGTTYQQPLPMPLLYKYVEADLYE